jgi:Tfp pilus assembly protein PilF
MRLHAVLVAALGAVLLAGCASIPAPLPPKAVQLNEDGAAALGAGETEVAEARLALALEYNPRFTEAWVNLGLVELRKRNFDVAQKDFARAHDLNPDLPAPLHAMGILEEVRGRTEAAAKRYRDALAVDPGFGASRANLGRLLFSAGAIEAAREQFLRLTEVAPEHVEGLAGLVECYWKLGRDTEATEVLARALRAFGDVPALALLHARQVLREGQLDEAQAQLIALTTSEDGRYQAPAWAWLSVARMAAGDGAGAERAAKEALARNAEEPVATYVLAQLAAR